jgi:flagellar hook-associated protein 2
MSTVGLSFGSPTSGDGFNVSATVSTIVANLAKIETPWKTALSRDESQDTVISDLGSLLSTLSTDLSTLTDAAGVLSEKTGSSSNTNVLQLTSATSSAASGTYTVVVNSLASTSSGYLTTLSSSSDTLSGSITLKVGSGTAQTITLGSSNDTLSGLAKAINNSGVGATASVVTDSNGTRLVLTSGTSGANGDITVSNNTLSAAASDTLGATVTAGSSTTTSSALFSAVTSATTTLSNSSTLTVQVGSGTAQTIKMSDVVSAVQLANGGATLTDLKNYINQNSSTLGFSASIATNSDGTSSLQLTSGTAGTSGTLTVNSSLATSSTALAYTQSATGANANLTIDGINYSSASNTVSNMIPGVSFELLSSSSSDVQVVIGNYTAGVESAVEQFVVDYNSLVSAINTQEGYDSSGIAEPLFGSPTLTLLQQDILSGFNSLNPSGYLSTVPENDTLSGSITLQVGSSSAETINMSDVSSAEGGITLADLEKYINSNSTSLGVTAAITTSKSASTMTLTSSLSGSNDALQVTSSLTASNGTSTTSVDYTGSSDIRNMQALGLTINTNGTISLNLTTLESMLNSDYSSVQGLFQNTDSWGMNFATTLTDAGTSSTNGVLKLATTANSSVESTLNAEISREQSQISVQQSKLIAELTSANEIMQEIPTQISEMNALYAAISGSS